MALWTGYSTAWRKAPAQLSACRRRSHVVTRIRTGIRNRTVGPRGRTPIERFALSPRGGLRGSDRSPGVARNLSAPGPPTTGAIQWRRFVAGDSAALRWLTRRRLPLRGGDRRTRRAAG